MAQSLRALTALAKDLGLIPNIYMQITTIHNCNSRGIQCPLLTSNSTRHTCGENTHMKAKYSCT